MARLKTLDLFCGCGGLTIGLEASGLADCHWAVEWNEAAAQTFQMNFPKAKVFNMDVEEWFLMLKVS